jgi:hypothetical protein
MTIITYNYPLTHHLLYVFTNNDIFFGATSFGHSLTIIQAFTYGTFELVFINR